MKSRRAFSAIVLVAALVATLLATSAATAGAATVQPPAEQALIDLLNQERSDRGLAPVAPDRELTDIARQHSARMAADAESGGRCGDGVTLRHRNPLSEGVTAAWTTLRENVGCNRPANPEKLHAALMDSPGHRANILAADVRFIGVGAVEDTDGGLWLTQLFMDAHNHQPVSPYEARAASPAPTATAQAITAEGIRASQTAFPRSDSAARAVISRNDVFADSLGGAALAGTDGVVLFTDPPSVRDGLRSDTRAELDRVLARGARVYLLGGTAAIGPHVRDELAAAGYRVVRLGGSDRYATAAQVAEAVVAANGGVQTIAVASGRNWPDAITAGAAAARQGFPLLLTDPGVLPAPTARFLGRHSDARRLILGGTAAISQPVGDRIDGTRLAGRTREETALRVADYLFGGTDGAIVVVDGWDEPSWGQALAWAPYAAANGAPQVLVSDAGVIDAVVSWVGRIGLGGEAVFAGGVEPTVAAQIRALLV